MEKSLKELYKLLLESFQEIDLKTYNFGICYQIDRLHYQKQLISIDEYNLLCKDFGTRRPKMFSKFYWNDSFIPRRDYWWTRNYKGNTQRLLFLEHINKKLKNKN